MQSHGQSHETSWIFHEKSCAIRPLPRSPRRCQKSCLDLEVPGLGVLGSGFRQAGWCQLHAVFVRIRSYKIFLIYINYDIMIYIYCYHRSSVNIAFGISRSELTKPGDQSMAGFDFINNTIKSGDRSMAGLDPIEVYISK